MNHFGPDGEPCFNPAIEHVIQFFVFDHLPEPLKTVSGRFAELAIETAHRSPDSRETTIALRKLLEAKDAAVRAVIDTMGPADAEAEQKLREGNP